MNNESLEAFLTRKKEAAEKSKVDWAERKSNWLKSVETLYKTIEEWLNDLIKKGLVVLSFSEETLNEGFIGEYKIRSLRLIMGNEVVTLTPIATIIVGGKGRVDMTGPEGTLVLIIPEWGQWSIANRTGIIELFPLTSESFSNALKEIMHK